jgi:hypothetical protein
MEEGHINQGWPKPQLLDGKTRVTDRIDEETEQNGEKVIMVTRGTRRCMTVSEPISTPTWEVIQWSYSWITISTLTHWKSFRRLDESGWHSRLLRGREYQCLDSWFLQIAQHHFFDEGLFEDSKIPGCMIWKALKPYWRIFFNTHGFISAYRGWLQIASVSLLLLLLILQCIRMVHTHKHTHTHHLYGPITYIIHQCADDFVERPYKQTATYHIRPILVIYVHLCKRVKLLPLVQFFVVRHPHP